MIAPKFECIEHGVEDDFEFTMTTAGKASAT